MSLIEKALALLREGAMRVDFEWNGKWVSAYWVGDVLRIDVHGLTKPRILIYGYQKPWIGNTNSSSAEPRWRPSSL